MTEGLQAASAALSLASAALDGLVKLTSSSAISDKVAAQLGVESDLAFIRDEFAMMRAFLKTADGAKTKATKRGKVITTWVRQVRVLAYDVEDCLTDSAMHLDRQSLSCQRLPRLIKARHRIAGEIKKLRARVEDVSQRNMRYRLIINDDGASQSQPSADDAADYYVGEQHSDKRPEARLITDLISSGGDALQVISVWGSYHHDSASVSVVRDAYEKLERSFKWRAWVNVARPFNHHEFVKSLLRHFYTNSVQKPAGGMEAMIKTEKMMAESTSRIHEEFERLVKEEENKFLFVLDDLDDAEVWLWIKTCLPSHQNGSRIIVRTQQLGIAMLCPKQPIQEAESELSDLLCGHSSPIYLFFNKGLVKGDSDPTLEREEGQSDSSLGATRKQVDELISAALEENSLVGRNSDASKVIDLLLTAESQDFIVVSGVDGIGKTALVKSISQSQKLSPIFERIAWYLVPDTFNRDVFVRRVTQRLEGPKKITGPFSSNKANTWNSIGKGTNVSPPDMGSSKGHLLILDDVSSMKQLDGIKLALREAQTKRETQVINKISRVIIITKEPDVAKSNTKSHILQPLEPEHALELFEKKVKDNLCCNTNQFQLAEDIVNKCGGHPQAINTVAGYLQKADIKEWKRFYEHLSNTKLKGINSILGAVYMSLPYNLKSCFLYLSVFPKDSEIRRRRLVRRWIAEGYSSEDNGTAAKHVAEKQFQGLIDRNMIQPSGTTINKISNSGETYHFELKNLMHEISKKKSAEENLLLILDEHDHSTFQGKSKARHLTVMSGWSREGMKSSTLGSTVDLSSIRSLTVFGECKSFFISKKMRMLRVLDLEDTYGLRDGDLSSIGKLYHLRYLSLRGSIGIFSLPNSLGNLSNLETLDVRGTMVTKLPPTIVKLQKLKYLRAGTISCDEDDTRDRVIKQLMPYLFMVFKICSRKEPEYAGMEELDLKVWVPLICVMVTIWLKGLDPHGVKAPKRIGRLRALHTLGVVNVARQKTTLEEIQELTQLQKLGITGINRNNCEDLEPAISNQRQLKSLSMRAEGQNGLKGCLDSMSPPEQLESLKLYGSLEKLPKWFGKLQSLVKLTLRSTLLKQSSVELLGKLQNLTSLRLLDKSFKGDVLQFQRGFENLMVLEIGGLFNVKSVKFEATAMPKLKLLNIECWWDTEVCSFTGVDLLSSLKEVLLSGLSEEDMQESDLDSEEQLVHRAIKDAMLKQLEDNKNKPQLKMG